MKKLMLTAVLTSVFAVTGAHADTTPVMFSSIKHFNAPAKNEVKGVRVSALHGQVDKVTGLDVSILGMSQTKDTVGVNIGLFFGGNRVTNSMTGASFGLFNIHDGDDLGANLSLVNITNNVRGANVSFVNYSEGNTMVDVGAASISDASTVQVGIFNMTKKIEGVQIGLINCAENGFFPCFPIVNFAK
ncbi:MULTISPECIES: VC2662 family protein [Vibrio]|uniref:PhaC PHA synthase n=1 Tax=Vibrio algicola TaxID=2662262 RepID=A0A5Q0TAN5_9VIBR|nr:MULTISPECIES: phaC PHA synthase [Vibrio]MBD1576839.1 phaC PHA synthase [Vibrio sp. S11_S32]